MRVPAASPVVEGFGHIGHVGHHKEQVRQGELGPAQEAETLLAPYPYPWPGQPQVIHARQAERAADAG